MLDSLLQFDSEAMLFINSFRSTFADYFMWVYSGKIIWGLMYLSIFYVLYKNFSIYFTLMVTAAIILTIVYADQICASLIRPLVERMRPSNPNNPLSEFVHIVNDKRGGRFGFPSCHSSNSFGLAFFLMLLFKQRKLTWFIMAWAVVNCYTRLYLGVHYPGDLLAGMIVGLTGALILYYLLRYLITIPQIAALAKGKDDIYLIKHPQEIKHANIIIWVGFITVLGIALYSTIRILI